MDDFTEQFVILGNNFPISGKENFISVTPDGTSPFIPRPARERVISVPPNSHPSFYQNVKEFVGWGIFGCALIVSNVVSCFSAGFE